MADLDFSLDLGSLACPAFIICGGKDSANKKASEELARRIPGASLRVISGSGHEVNQQAPAQLAEVLIFGIIRQSLVKSRRNHHLLRQDSYRLPQA